MTAHPYHEGMGLSIQPRKHDPPSIFTWSDSEVLASAVGHRFRARFDVCQCEEFDSTNQQTGNSEVEEKGRADLEGAPVRFLLKYRMGYDISEILFRGGRDP